MARSPKESSTYGQYCPLALAAEVLCRRWSVLIVSRLLGGCSTFNEIHRGVPRISPSLLSTRLAELEHAGVARRRKGRGENRHRYELTDAGRDLADVIQTMAVWGQFWSRDMNLDDLDPAFLAWSMQSRMNVDSMPPGRTVIEFEFTGTHDEFRRFWLVSEDGRIDMCLKHPGYETDLFVQADLLRFIETWRGFRDLRAEIRSRNIRLTGSRRLMRAFPDWLQLHVLASLQRKAKGREHRLGLQAGNSKTRKSDMTDRVSRRDGS
jgi:DNA-binding HxlR family transcriptional regulator